MATPEAQDAAARERIIKHMNADHQDSIQRYLEVASPAWFYQLRSAKMTHIDNTHMKFTYGSGQTATIPFEPPLKSLREARERLVQLDKDALDKLNRDGTPIKTFIPASANPGHLFNFTQCLFGYVILFRGANFRPGSLLYDTLLFRAPQLAELLGTLRPYILALMLGIHITESVLMARKLGRHGLRPSERLWWLWVGTCFVEGVTSFWRLDGWIKARREEKEAKKH